jgi:deoxyribodipyrimidine photo-lyase
MTLSVVLLNDTLRWHDNPLFSAGTGPKAAVVVLDQAAFFAMQYGMARANLHRLQQQLAVIAKLKISLAAQNIGLITLVGNVGDCIRRLATTLNADSLYCAEPVAANETATVRSIASALTVHQLDCNSLLGDTLRPDLATLPQRFTPFRQQREPLLRVSPPVSTTADSSWLTPGQTEAFNRAFMQLHNTYQGPVAAVNSEQHALQRVAYYLWQQQHILHYKHSRNQLAGEDYASFFSAPLALGTLSVRHVWQQIVSFEQQVQANESTYWLKFELLWREFFRWQFRQHGTRWFSKSAINAAADFTPPTLSKSQKSAFSSWCAGETGVPFIDANMRLLNQTGLMSNRGRQNVASYLCHDLAVDWRLGAAYFEQRLLDYDCASNWGNWAYIAGSGNSGQRQFNVIKQALEYDANGDFVRAMLPQLSASGSLIHRPAATVSIRPHWQRYLDKMHG